MLELIEQKCFEHARHSHTEGFLPLKDRPAKLSFTGAFLIFTFLYKVTFYN